MDKIEQLNQRLQKAKRIVFFCGAGVSTESGIPDFRSSEGIYSKETGLNYSAEEIISHAFFAQHPKEFFEFYFDKLIYPEAKPNSSHQFMADLEKEDKEVTIITQNIDGLHQMAGSSNVLELHGTVHENYCVECHTHYDLTDLQLDTQGIPRCPKDGSIVRPDIVLYQEQLDTQVLEQSVESIEKADLLIIAGTSMTVYPAAGLVNYFKGEQLAVINKTEVRVQRPNTLIFKDSLANVFSKLSL
ncbi:NAD-dependent protein deacylase [Aerococcaceae bacterium WGS1372]